MEGRERCQLAVKEEEELDVSGDGDGDGDGEIWIDDGAEEEGAISSASGEGVGEPSISAVGAAEG